ncbi:META domain-containing protein [Gelidibacter sediminis]|uniref:META domain-containing protein n=1 Tax=Gelidibacter sediminis TaxID=1608710 RepID=A0A4R7QA90_9FLAO|nr:META domain-containing protein [Gelidibacter sediminis]TDU43680.1 META domain-containing protein [Gelidibacter sediminis]
MKYVLSLTVLFCLILFNCKTQEVPKKQTETVHTVDKKSVAHLVGAKWVLTKLNGDIVNLSKTELEQPFIRLTAKDNGVGGNSGCNPFGGTFTLKGNQNIQFSEMLATMRYCDDNGIEGVFMANLQKAATYIITNNELTLKDENGYVLSTFEAVED